MREPVQVADTEQPSTSTSTAPRTGSPWLDGSLSVITAGLLLLAFDGLLRLNKVRSQQYRNYGSDWFDRLPIKEVAFFAGIIFLCAPAALFLARALWLTATPLLDRAATALARRARVVLVVAMVGALAATAVFSWKFVKRTPLTPDEQVQLFQARILETGRIAVPSPPAEEPFVQPELIVTNGVWTGIYQWGHPMLLALGDQLGFPFLWTHLCAVLLVLLTWLLARELYPDDKRSAVIAVMLTATSPFVIFTCATLSNAPTSAVLVTLGAWALLRHVRTGRLGWALLGGLAFGIDLHVRPFNALLLGGLLGVMALVALLRAGKPWTKLAVGFSLGVVPLASAQLLINWQITGNPLRPALGLARGYRRVFGFRGRMAYGVSNLPREAAGKLATNALRLLLWTSGSALTGAALLAAAAGWLKKRGDALLLVPPAFLLLGYLFFYRSPVSDTGPVYFLDALPFLTLFVARALLGVRDRLAARIGDTAATARVAAIGVVAVVLAMVTFWPVQARGVRRAARAIRAPIELAEKANLHRALVWCANPPGGQSWLTVPPLPWPDFRDDVVFARDTVGKTELMDALGDRTTYLVRYPRGRPTLFEWRIDLSDGGRLITKQIYPEKGLPQAEPRRGEDFMDAPSVNPLMPLRPDQFDPGSRHP